MSPFRNQTIFWQQLSPLSWSQKKKSSVSELGFCVIVFACRRSAIRTKLAGMTEFERKAAVARLRLKREEEKGELMGQRAALGAFFSVRHFTDLP